MKALAQGKKVSVTFEYTDSEGKHVKRGLGITLSNDKDAKSTKDLVYAIWRDRGYLDTKVEFEND